MRGHLLNRLSTSHTGDPEPEPGPETEQSAWPFMLIRSVIIVLFYFLPWPNEYVADLAHLASSHRTFSLSPSVILALSIGFETIKEAIEHRTVETYEPIIGMSYTNYGCVRVWRGGGGCVCGECVVCVLCVCFCVCV